MRLRNVKNKEEIMNSSSLLVRDEAKYKKTGKVCLIMIILYI